MAEWSTLNDVDLSAVESTAKTVQDISSTIAGFLVATAALLRAIGMFISPDVDIIRSLIAAALLTLEAMIEDLLQNNAAMALHINLVWDPDWVWDIETVPEDRRTSTPNWTEGRDLPWKSNGIDGWLTDIVASTYQTSDPFRPLTDGDTMVTGFIYVVGVPSNDGLSDILQLLDVFTDWSDFKDVFDEGKYAGENKAMMRAKHALLSERLRDYIFDKDAIKEDLKVALSDDLTDWSFHPGAFPKWVSVPMARIFPPIYKLFRRLQAVVAALRVPSEKPRLVLAELLARKAEILAELSVEVGEIILQLLALAELLEGGHFIWLQVGSLDAGSPDSASGGMSSFISEAMGASGKPDLGPTAIFGGVVGVVTLDNPAHHLQSFFQLVGVSVNDLTSETTSQAAQIEDTIDEVTSYF